MGENDQKIKRIIEIPARKFGSRRLDSKDFSSFLNDLKEKFALDISPLRVWRFGHDGLLEYPWDKINEAINYYDVSRIVGRGSLIKKGSVDVFIEFDLSNSYGGSSRFIFSLNGPKETVDSTINLIEEHIFRWPKTWHHGFHKFKSLYVIIIMLCFLYALIRGKTHWSDFNLTSIVVFFIWGYILFLASFLTNKIDSYGPYIWFFRSGGIVESSRKWLPRITVGAIITIIGGLAVNLIWKFITEP
ncbi:MAG: hypothetical protein IH886_07515 [Nitrospinae bacterium]|nr:hypothetical protein [Nitrospinota bacterium]